MPKLKIITNKPIALDSQDHLAPWGTSNDNSLNLDFNKKLSQLIPIPQWNVLDLGCAGGGFVKSVLDAGGFAVGIDGSDYSRKTSRAEWATIPDHLFTADITEPFQLLQADPNGTESGIRFNLITAWEVLEHIQESRLMNVFENIQRHLLPDGIVILSISASKGILNETRYHQTIHGKDWWQKKILEFGFSNHKTGIFYFGGDWVRGWYDLPLQFHFVLTRTSQRDSFVRKVRSLPLSCKRTILASWALTPFIFLLAALKMRYDNKKMPRP